MARMLLRAVASVALLACGCAANEDATCTSPAEPEQPALGHAMLQTKQERTAPKRFAEMKRQASNLKQPPNTELAQKASGRVPLVPNAACPLPAAATWCQVRLKNLPPYLMAVYADQDWVSWNICHTGFWEDADMAGFGVPGRMMDIGGNIGYHTFAFAQAGWGVTTFEPMAPNLAMMKATMCQNPQFVAKVHINPFGLGTSAQACKMMAPKDNVGDGFTKCGAPGEAPAPGFKFKEIGTFNVRRLDTVLIEQKIEKVDLVKIDVEGYEYQVFAGAPNFLAKYKPRLIKSELWNSMTGATGTTYLSMFEAQGYKFFKDSRCQVPVDAKQEILKGGMDVVMCTMPVAAPAIAKPV